MVVNEALAQTSAPHYGHTTRPSRLREDWARASLTTIPQRQDYNRVPPRYPQKGLEAGNVPVRLSPEQTIQPTYRPLRGGISAKPHDERTRHASRTGGSAS